MWARLTGIVCRSPPLFLLLNDLALRRVLKLFGLRKQFERFENLRIAFKQKVSGGGLLEVKWRLSVLDLDTLEDHPLAETRTVDDQAEWLDDGTVLYGLASDTYAVAADGSGAPRLFIPRADSPVVVPRSD